MGSFMRLHEVPEGHRSVHTGLAKHVQTRIGGPALGLAVGQDMHGHALACTIFTLDMPGKNGFVSTWLSLSDSLMLTHNCSLACALG